MTQEIRFSTVVTINKDGLSISDSKSFAKDMTTAKGPAPGSFQASVTGTLIDLTNLSTYGVVVFKNYDSTNKFEIGFYVGTTFYPYAEIGPGEEYSYYLSENLGEQYGTAGTGTTGPALEDFLMVRAINAAVNVSVEIYER